MFILMPIPSSSLRLKLKAYQKGSEPLRDGKSFYGNTETGSELRTRSRKKFWLSWYGQVPLHVWFALILMRHSEQERR